VAPQQNRWLSLALYGNAAVLTAIALGLFLAPVASTVANLTDPALRAPGVPRVARTLFLDLSPRYETWARERMASKRAEALSTSDISGTEWPLFGSVFYLWAVESLQRAYEAEPESFAEAPSVFARGAIDGALELVLDPNHASWVRRHWGEEYLSREDVFYRMLRIAALTSHQRVTGDRSRAPQLAQEAERLAAELDASQAGWLDDYPGECYPTDVLAAVAAIRRADEVLGTDHREFASRMRRGFEGGRLDRWGLVPYAGDKSTGVPHGTSRGCSNSFASLSAPELWPDLASAWYRAYEAGFWQETWTAAGFREWPRELPGYDWTVDVDAGPVLAGFGFAACAFGEGAARLNGRFDHAWPLTAEMLAIGWILPNGTWLAPRMLSNAADAPYLGEAAILCPLTRRPGAREVVTGGSGRAVVGVLLGLYLLGAAACVWRAWGRVRRWHREGAAARVRAPRVQLALWAGLLAVGVVAALSGWFVPAAFGLIAAQLLPFWRP